MVAPGGVAVRRLAALGLLAALLAAGSGCGSRKVQQAKETSELARSGDHWRRISPAERVNLVRFCKAPAGLAAAQGDRSVPAAYFSDRYQAVQRLAVPLLAREISLFFADPRHRSASIQRACSAMAMRLTATSAPVPRAVFAAPATRVNGPIELDIERDSFILRGRLSAHGTHARVAAAPDRAATGVTAAVRVRGLDITVAFARIPSGVSYLQLILYGRGTQHTDLIVVRRAQAGHPSSAGFSPIRLRGNGNRTIPLLEVPSAAVLTYSSAGLGLGISDARGQLHLATTARTGALRVAPGAYRGVQIVAGGPWQIVIAPRRGPA